MIIVMSQLWQAAHTSAILDIFLKIVGLATLIVLICQLRIQQHGNITIQRAHLVDVYRNVFGIVDKSDIREARRFLYRYGDDRRARIRTDLEADDKMRSKVAELVRAFDQLGLLVREGLVPLDVISRFYASPALRCWYILTPYILDERESRNQPGHLWEWENLVTRIIIPGLNSEGIWSGVALHDELGLWADKVKEDLLNERFKRWSDEVYMPGFHPWTIQR